MATDHHSDGPRTKASYLWVVYICPGIIKHAVRGSEDHASILAVGRSHRPGRPEPSVRLERDRKWLSQVRQGQALRYCEDAFRQAAAAPTPQCRVQQEDLVLALHCSGNGAPAPICEGGAPSALTS